MTWDDVQLLAASLFVSLEILVVIYLFKGNPKSEFHRGLCEGLTFQPIIKWVKTWLNKH